MAQARLLNRAPWIAALALAAFVAGCDQPPPDVPPARAEMMGKPPVTETALIWQPGHYDWNGSAYVWMPGFYVERTGHSDYFQSGHWERTAPGWRWDPAHWLPLS